MKTQHLSKKIILPAAVVILAVIGFGLYLWLKPQSLVPQPIKKQLNFMVLYPSSSASVERQSFKYDQSSKTLSFIAKQGDISVTITEQSTPESFVDIPQAYDKLVESLNNYSSFDSINGRVSLTHPKELNGQQTAVMNAKGTLLFAHPTNGDLSLDQWKQLFNSLSLAGQE